MEYYLLPRMPSSSWMPVFLWQCGNLSLYNMGQNPESKAECGLGVAECRMRACCGWALLSVPSTAEEDAKVCCFIDIEWGG